MSTPFRSVVGGILNYRGHQIIATFIGPDLLGYIDGNEMSNFYSDLRAVETCAKRQIDETIKEQRNKNA